MFGINSARLSRIVEIECHETKGEAAIGRVIGAPTARPAARVARKTGRLDQRFDYLQEV
jgi:hypothetical protein